jgi:hypothetical protein
MVSLAAFWIVIVHKACLFSATAAAGSLMIGHYQPIALSNEPVHRERGSSESHRGWALEEKANTNQFLNKEGVIIKK